VQRQAFATLKHSLAACSANFSGQKDAGLPRHAGMNGDKRRIFVGFERRRAMMYGDVSAAQQDG
jgi:hypothetical protein